MKWLAPVLVLLVWSGTGYGDCGTHVSGTIVDETWSEAGSPYCVTGDILVASLTIEPGVTVKVSQQSYTQLGFGDLFDQLMDGLTNSTNGTMTLADDVIQDQIDLAEDRIEDYDERLEAKRARMQREFAAMENNY